MIRPLETTEALGASLQCWLEQVVLRLDLCPFAGRTLRAGRLAWYVTEEHASEQLLHAVYQLLEQMEEQPESRIETALLAIPNALSSFDDYLEFVALSEQLLAQCGWEGSFQLASFHPDYCFAGVASADISHYTNRSPCPLLHVLRESSVSRVLDAYPDPEQIPVRNVERLRQMDADERARLIRLCRGKG